MRRRALIAGCAVLCLLLVMVPVGAQNAPEAPRITAAGAAVNALTVAWAAPANDGGAAISAYDLRYIRNDATDKADDHWTVEDDVWRSGDGALRSELKDLFDGTQYDLQVRAVNANGAGLWSATYEATTRDHSGSRSGATTLSPGSSAPGRIDPRDDEDFFRIVLADAADLWLYTSGRDDTVGELLRADGTVLAADDDGVLLDGPRNFSIRRQLPAGTYYATVGSFGALDTAAYTLHARLVSDPGDTKDRATAVTPGSFAPGRIGPEGGVDGDKDYFKLELTSAAEIWVMAVGPVDTVGELLDADENVLAENDDSEFVDNEKGFMIRRQLATGTYYVRVSGYNADDTGPYTLFARVATEPGNSTATAGPITLHIPESGRIASSSDQDYFRLTLEEETYVFVYALAFGYVRLIGDDLVFVDPLPLRATVFDAPEHRASRLVRHPACDLGRARASRGQLLRLGQAGRGHVPHSNHSSARRYGRDLSSPLPGVQRLRQDDRALHRPDDAAERPPVRLPVAPQQHPTVPRRGGSGHQRGGGVGHHDGGGRERGGGRRRVAIRA